MSHAKKKHSKIYTAKEREALDRKAPATPIKASPAPRNGLTPHPLAERFPAIKGPAFDDLVSDIKEHGQREPIVILDGRILDGLNRYRACELLGIVPRAREFGSELSDGSDPRAFVISENVRRRHLNANQRAVLASDLAELGLGANQHGSANLPTLSQAEAAALCGTSERTVRSARCAMNPPTLVDPEAEGGTPSRLAAKAGLQDQLDAWREFVRDGETKISKAATCAERPDLVDLIQRADLVAKAGDHSKDPAETKRLFQEAIQRQLDGDSAEPEKAEQTSGRGKPAWLMRALVRHYSYLGDLICDPLAGYGSTLRAARDEGRRAVGSEIDASVARIANDSDIRVGRWQDALSDIDMVDAVICDPPYSARTHSAGTTRNDDSTAIGLTPTYNCWTPEDVSEFVDAWAPRTKRWLVALTDSELWPAWRESCERNGLHTFQPIPCVIRGMSVRVGGDGPSSWAIWAVVARTKEASNMGTRPGAYVGTKTRALWDPEESEEADEEDSNGE